MLKPQANSTRELVSLDGIWNFAVASEDIDQERAWTRAISPRLQAPVPASYNDVFVDAAIRDHVGWVYYQRQVTIPHTWGKLRYFLRFDAATHRGRAFVNDDFLVDHAGGYTPFEAEVTKLVAPGQEFRLTVAVNNELSWDTIPPGRVETLASGKRKQHYQHDFFNYAGLSRSVWLYAVPQVFVDDVTVVTDVEGDDVGVVDFEIHTSEPLGACTCSVALIDEDGKIVGKADGLKGRVVVENANLWQPGASYLYRLRSELRDGHRDLITDTYSVAVGIRSVRVKGKQFLINNKPFYFKGFGKHEDSAVRGKGFDAAYMVHDFQLMKWTGANSFRTSHYPYAEEVLDYADRHGVVVINETAAVGLNLNIVAGVFGWKSNPTFSPSTASDRTQAAHAQAIRELVARDKNHASVVLWTIANEPGSSEPGAREYMEPLAALARELDPSRRPICFANMGHATARTDLITDLFDVVCLNRYYGWYTQSGALDEAEAALEADLLQWQATHDKPILVTEYGAECLPGLHAAAGDVPWTEEYQARFLETFHRVFDRVDAVVGEHVWNFADFHCVSTMFRVDGNRKGIFTRDRKPKAAAHVLKRRWEGS